MSQYHTFTAHDTVAYAQQFAGIDNPSELVSAQEVGDGNLNLVFKVFDRQGVSRAIVKQALPYVRCVGESWPLTLDRARLEAQTLVAHYQHSPQHTVKTNGIRHGSSPSGKLYNQFAVPPSSAAPFVARP